MYSDEELRVLRSSCDGFGSSRIENHRADETLKAAAKNNANATEELETATEECEEVRANWRRREGGSFREELNQAAAAGRGAQGPTSTSDTVGARVSSGTGSNKRRRPTRRETSGGLSPDRVRYSEGAPSAPNDDGAGAEGSQNPDVYVEPDAIDFEGWATLSDGPLHEHGGNPQMMSTPAQRAALTAAEDAFLARDLT